MAIEALCKEFGKAGNSVSAAREKGWTKYIDESLLPQNLIGAKEENRLSDLIQKVFTKTLTFHDNKYEVREYILDWLFLTGAYFIMEEGTDAVRNEAYEQAMNYTKSL